MIDGERRPKPVLLAMKQFAEDRKKWDVDLPGAREDAVCILTSGQDQWGTAYMAWCLAKQVSMNLRFCYAGSTRHKYHSVISAINSCLFQQIQSFFYVVGRAHGCRF